MKETCQWCKAAREMGGMMCRPCFRAFSDKPKLSPQRLANVGKKPCPCCKRKPHSERKATFINIAHMSMPGSNTAGFNGAYWWIKLTAKGKQK